jgi:hypothetical protein
LEYFQFLAAPRAPCTTSAQRMTSRRLCTGVDVEDFEREFGFSKGERVRAFVGGPPLVRRVLLQRTLRYWQLRHWFDRMLFRAMRSLYRVRTWAKDARSATSLFTVLARAIAGQTFFALALIVAVVVLERIVTRYTRFHLPAPSSSGAGVRDALNTIAQIAGIVLTLYYTALSVVISTAYAKLPADLRSLIVREKSSYLYVKLLALTCAGSLILLGLDSFGIGVAGLPFVMILSVSVLSVLSFVSLGLSAFRFFDPAVLVHQLTEDFLLALQAAAGRSVVTAQPSFQQFFQQRAAAALETYGEVITASSEPPHRAHLGTLVFRVAELLRAYAPNKVRIAPDSLWFARQSKHPRWLLTSDTTVAMALNTGTTLQPELVANRDWVEQAIGQHVTQALRIALADPPSENVHTIAASVRRGAAHLANAGDVDGALRFCQETYASFCNAAPESVPPEQEVDWLAAHEELCLASIEAVLGFRRFVERLTNATALRSAFQELHRTGRISAEPPLLPAQLAPALQQHREHLNAQRLVEGSPATPEWHTTQIIAARLAAHTGAAAAALVGEIEGFVARCARRPGRLRTLMSAQAGQRGLELVSKMEAVLDVLITASESLVSLRTTEEESWKDLPVQQLGERLRAARERLAIAIAQLAASVTSEEDREDRPDFFGFTYTIAAQECFNAMLRADETAFAQLFPEFFGAALTTFDRVPALTKDFEPEARILIRAEPILDLLDLSGFAELFSAILGGGYSDISRAQWEKYLSAHPRPTEAIGLLAAVMTIKSEALLRIAPRDMIRMDWSTKFDHFLVERGLIGEPFYGPYDRGSLRKKDTHQSPFVRALPENGLDGLLHARDVFAAAYLVPRPEASQVAFGRAVDEFRADLQESR